MKVEVRHGWHRTSCSRCKRGNGAGRARRVAVVLSWGVEHATTYFCTRCAAEHEGGAVRQAAVLVRDKYTIWLSDARILELEALIAELEAPS